MSFRFAIAALALCAPAFAWTESVEFNPGVLPRQIWERELVWMKNIGVRHVSVARGTSGDTLTEVISLIRRVGLEADLEGPVPPSLEPLSKQHGGPLTGALAGAQRLSVLQSGALSRSRELLLAGTPALIWTDVEDSLSPAGYRAGAVSVSGQETPATAVLRRNAQLAAWWSDKLSSLHESPGAGTRLPDEAITVKQYAADNGVSLVSVSNASLKPWTGDVRALYPVLHRVIILPNVIVPAHDTIWLPVGIPLANGFSPQDHIVYSTAEITAVEFENGIIAMEFSAPGAGEVLLQLSHEPSGPLVAGGKPAAFDWDEHTNRARLPVPMAPGQTHHTRIGLAMDAPDSTGFFDTARVLLIGEVNKLTAQFSSEAVAQRSRIVLSPGLSATQEEGRQPLEAVYRITVPATAAHGDHADLALEADGARLSHARPQLLYPVGLRFPDAVAVPLGPNAALPLDPVAIPVNQRSGAEFTINLRNNANEIRTFQISVSGEGLEFSPSRMTVTVGASDARDLSFRIFPSAELGLRKAEVRVEGAVRMTQPVSFVLIPQTGAIAWSADGFSFLESAKTRAGFLPGRWLEYLNKANGNNVLPVGGMPFAPGPIDTESDRLAVAGKSYALTDLDALLPKPKR